MDHIIQLNNRLPYNTKLKDRTKELRKNMTEPEKKLWNSFLKPLQKAFFLLPPQVRGIEWEFVAKVVTEGSFLSEVMKKKKLNFVFTNKDQYIIS